MFKRQLFLLAIIVVLSLITFNEAYSKHIRKSTIMDTTKTYKISTIDKSELIGKFVDRDTEMIIIKTISLTNIEIPISNIKKIEEIESPTYKNGEYWFENPNASRYFFSSSAINLKEGQAYYQNTYIFLNSFGIGISDNLSVSAGIEFFTTVGSLGEGDFAPGYFVSPKLSFDVSENLHLGVGYFYSRMFTIFGNVEMGYLYGVGTLGNRSNNYSFTIGWNGSGLDFDKNPLIGFSATMRVAKGVALITDNLVIPTYQNNHYTNVREFEYFPYFSYGVRFFGEKLAFDLALINNPEIVQKSAIGYPLINFVVNF